MRPINEFLFDDRGAAYSKEASSTPTTAAVKYDVHPGLNPNMLRDNASTVDCDGGSVVLELDILGRKVQSASQRHPCTALKQMRSFCPTCRKTALLRCSWTND